MYRHLLVPLDASPLSVDTVRRAVELARALQARITFFHAQEDWGATSVGALERVIAPADYNEHMAGEARALLSKAEVVAREAGVAYDSLWVTSNRPHEAILDAAEARGCDLVFMASHGRRGMKGLVLGSQTQKVLQNATLPVLVSAVETNLRDGELNRALITIGDEHRSLAAVLHGLEFLVRDARETGTPPPFALLRAIVHYIRAFPEKLHHPKEDAYLFRKLRERTHEFDETLDELERQHVEGAKLVDRLEETLGRYEADPAANLDAFATAVARFAAMQMHHMRLESKVILPAAREHLTREDWTEIDRAFAGNGDPRFSADNDDAYRALFARILNLAPEGVVGAAGRG
jgi:nucleotide-binding universal stress UspA family protein/hemerythrin-like domain-containing protein